jgi:hypothetical protein
MQQVLGPEHPHIQTGFLCSSSALQGKCPIPNSIKPCSLPCKSFSIHQSFYYSIVYSDSQKGNIKTNGYRNRISTGEVAGKNELSRGPRSLLFVIIRANIAFLVKSAARVSCNERYCTFICLFLQSYIQFTVRAVVLVSVTARE